MLQCSNATCCLHVRRLRIFIYVTRDDLFHIPADPAYSSAYREDNFVVGLTNNSPGTMPPVNYGYSKCGQWNGAAPSGASMTVSCADNLPPYRYVTILGQITNNILQICELEIYGKGMHGVFIQLSLAVKCLQH
jgi:hypothetical protein